MHRYFHMIWLLSFLWTLNALCHAEPHPDRIIFLSDTQDPLWFERLILSGNSNVEASELILNQIIREDVAAIFHLGDMVSIGYDQEGWYRIDQFLLQLKKRQIPLYATLGNHELFLFPDHGAEAFMKRFPAYEPRGYLVRVGPAAIIILNSNFGYPDDDQITQQQTWYEHVLDSCQQDSSIRTIIVGCHHPPFTNSKIVSPNEDVQRFLLPGFIRNSKTKLFLSGHSHAFEHFSEYGKDFMVIGGGGGLQHPLALGNEAKYKDHFSGPDKRGFHFLTCVVTGDSLKVNINMVTEDLSGVEVIYSIDIGY